MSTTILQKLFKRSPEPLEFMNVPAHLGKIPAPTAAEICQTSQPQPSVRALLKPQHTPAQFLGVLQEYQLGEDMLKTLAHGLPDREGVWWSCQSAMHVAEHLPPADKLALQAAQKWVKEPTESNKAAAAAAAAMTDCRGPGALAALGAAWSQPETRTEQLPGKPVLPRLTPNAVVGAVMLSSAIKANPTLAAPAAQAASVNPPAPAKVESPAKPVAQPPASTPPLAARSEVAVPNAPTPSVAVPQNFQTSTTQLRVKATPGSMPPIISQPQPAAVPVARDVPMISSPVPQPSQPAGVVPKVVLPVPPTLAVVAPQTAPAKAAAGNTQQRAAPSAPPPVIVPPPAVPAEVQALVFQQQYPFIALGLEIASGRNTWS